MNFLTRRFGLCIISVSATSLLCVLLIAVVAQKGVSKGLLTQKPSVELQVSTTKITYPCPPGGISISGSCPSTPDFQVALTSIAKDFNKQPSYTYTVGGGRVDGEGNKVIWNLSGLSPGSYTATVEVQDAKKHRAISSVIVKIVHCTDCLICDNLCPTIAVSCYDEVKAGTPMTCKVVLGGPRSDRLTYEWSARDSSGEDLAERISGRGTSISISTNGLAGHVYTIVEVKGLDPSCARTASGSTKVKP